MITDQRRAVSLHYRSVLLLHIVCRFVRVPELSKVAQQ